MKFKEFTFGGSHHSSSYFRAFILQQNVFKLKSLTQEKSVYKKLAERVYEIYALRYSLSFKVESTKLLKEPSPSLTQLSISCEEEITLLQMRRNEITLLQKRRNEIIL
ncbi:unnamed protein product [Rhizophagus irregularis]|nr:unnamed protein product [Rhizophagus irregularis]